MAERILMVIYTHDTSSRPEMATALEEALGCKVDVLAVPFGAKLYGLFRLYRSGFKLGRYDAILSGGYHSTYFLAVRLLLNRKPVMISSGLNQSHRLFATKSGLVNRFLDSVWRRVDAFIVHSSEERYLFHRRHDIPLERLHFVHWGYDLPARKPVNMDLPDVPFVSMIGRNNRDVRTFCDAVEAAGVHGVVVTSEYVMRDFTGSVPASVSILCDVSLDHCLEIVERSFAHLILVKDGDRGAGHISAVTAMLLNKPQIFTDLPMIRDYMEDGVNGIGVPLHDAPATAQAIKTLLADPAFAARLAEAGQQKARAELSSAAVLRKQVELIARLLGRPVQPGRAQGGAATPE